MKLKYFVVVIVLLTAGCGKDSPSLPDVKDPAKATLVFPEQNAVCTSGTVISANETSIVLSWNAADNTDSYEVSIKNLLTGGITVKTATSNQLTATLLRNTPYSWHVVSKSAASTVTADSDTWKFYVSGLGTTSYSPFPAAVGTPTFGQVIASGATSVNLTWAGSDVDNDIAGYDVYFGSTTTPALFKGDVKDMFVNNVTVTAGATYYWKVVTKDARGNTSDSGLFQFKVN